MTNENEQAIGLKKFQERTLELAGGDQDKAELANKFAELEMDFEFVKDLNTQIANKYQEIMECFPTSKEIEILIYFSYHNENDISPEPLVYTNELKEERLTKLKKFRSALVALESQDPTAKPVRYDELFNGKKERE